MRRDVLTLLAASAALTLLSGCPDKAKPEPAAGKKEDKAQERRIIMNALRDDIEQTDYTSGSNRSWLLGTDDHSGEADADTHGVGRLQHIGYARSCAMEHGLPLWTWQAWVGSGSHPEVSPRPVGGFRTGASHPSGGRP